MISPAQSPDLARQVSGLGQLLMRAGSRDKALSTQPLTENKHSLTHSLALHGTYYDRRIERKTR
jgi:hypothetical protein